MPGSTVGAGALDRRQVQRAFGRAAGTFDQADFIQTVVRDRLLERLDLVRLETRCLLDLGTGTGRALGELGRRFPAATLLALDLVPAMLGKAIRRPGNLRPLPVCADAGQLPLADASVDLVFSNLMIHWCPDPDRVFQEVRRVLRQPGLFCFATLGPESFRELRTAWQTADDGLHVMDFPQPDALADGLLRAGFAEPVVDVDTVTIEYPDLRGLTRDLRTTGTTNARSDRARGLTGRARWARMAAAYESLRNPAGGLPATLQIVCAQAWSPDPRRRAGRGEQVLRPAIELKGAGPKLPDDFDH